MDTTQHVENSEMSNSHDLKVTSEVNGQVDSLSEDEVQKEPKKEMDQTNLENHKEENEKLIEQQNFESNQVMEEKQDGIVNETVEIKHEIEIKISPSQNEVDINEKVEIKEDGYLDINQETTRKEKDIDQESKKSSGTDTSSRKEKDKKKSKRKSTSVGKAKGKAEAKEKKQKEKEYEKEKEKEEEKEKEKEKEEEKEEKLEEEKVQEKVVENVIEIETKEKEKEKEKEDIIEQNQIEKKDENEKKSESKHGTLESKGKRSKSKKGKKGKDKDSAKRKKKKKEKKVRIEDGESDEKGSGLLRKISTRMSSDQPVIGTKVDEHHKNYILMYDMLLGIRTTLSRCHAKPARPLQDEDFTSAHKIAFDITGYEMTPSSKYDFKFKDYSPWVFRSLRESFKLDAADYLVSLTGRYVLSELGTPGKSGSFFYFSQDYRFIIKTISHTEHKFFRKILRNYYDYVIANPNTLISRYYGLHRVKLPRGPKIHFVVMGNILPPNRDIHEVYDLKGSTVGRIVEVTEEQLASGKTPVLKDLNFKRKIVLGPKKRAEFFEQIQKDSTFLGEMNIMDYSLLLGIHDLTRGNSEQIRDRALSVLEPPHPKKKQNETISKEQRKAMKKAISRAGPVALDQSKAKLPEQPSTERKQSVFYRDGGGYQSTDENDLPLNEIYHMGIIDILTPYDGVKKMEHMFKSINNDPNLISAIPPPKYAQRFADFVVNGTTNRDKVKKRGSKKSFDLDSSDPDVSN